MHRDLKPHNIMLDEAGKLYVADFGLAMLLEGEGGSVKAARAAQSLTSRRSSLTAGLARLARRAISTAWVILYELITGQPPFPRTRESILRTLDTDPLPPSRSAPGSRTAWRGSA